MDEPQKSRLTFLKRATDRPQRPQRRHGVALLPSLFTMGNLYCGYASLVHSLRGDYASAAVFIGVSFAFDMFDGFIARLTNTASDFGVELDSLADIVSFGVAPAILSYSWGLKSLGRAGWVCCFIFVAAAALRLARFNVQSGSTDKRFFAGMPSPSAAAIPAATVFAFPNGLGADDIQWAIPALAMVVGPALLMVSTIRFRSFKTIDLQTRRPYTVLLLVAIAIIVVNVHLPYSLLTLAYGYLTWTFVELGVTRFRHRRGDDRGASGELKSEEAAKAPAASSTFSRPKRR